MPTINKGDRVPLKQRAQGCRPPTPAVCYHSYEAGREPKTVYCYLFPNGNTETFTRVEALHFFDLKKAHNFNKVALYSYENYQQLKDDYQRGYFDVCFEGQPIVTDDIQVTQQRLDSLEARKGAAKIILVRSLGTKRYGLIVRWSAEQGTWELYDENFSGNLYTCLIKITN